MERQCLFVLISLSLAMPVQASDETYYYIIKKNEYVSSILYRAHLKSIYGKIGTLDLLKKLNVKRIPDINKIIPGEKIFFPGSLALKAKERGAVDLTAQNEIVFIDEVIPRILASESNPAQVAVPNKINFIKSEDTSAQSAINFSIESGYSRIDSNQGSGSATLLSKPITGFHLEWSQYWSDDWQSFIGWGRSSVSFTNTSQGTVVGGEKQTTSHLGLGLIYQLSSKLNTTVEVGTKEEIFAPSYSTGTATLEAKPVSFFKLSFSRNLVEVRQLRLSGSLGGSYLFGLSNSDYDIKSGYEYFGGLRVTHQLKSISIFASGEYIVTFQDTSLSTQSLKDIRTQIGVSIPFGAVEETKGNSP